LAAVDTWALLRLDQAVMQTLATAVIASLVGAWAQWRKKELGLA
jgi:hypothetical protein